jgi:hypothetical protein
MLTYVDTKVAKVAKDKNYVCKCGKKYFHRQSLSLHRKKCEFLEDGKKEQKEKEEEKEDKKLVEYLVKENSDLKKMILDVCKNIGSNGNYNNNTTNSNNKTFNLQFFLNETCKDAMNIMEFVDSIQLQLSDLAKVGDIGYVEGISNIITNNLKALDVTQRPIHCTDKKREILYVKDDNQWEKESEDRAKIKTAIKQVANKNMKKIPEWISLNPDCYNSSSKNNDKYLQIVSNSMSGSTVEEQNTNIDKIISKVAKEVAI